MKKIIRPIGFVLWVLIGAAELLTYGTIYAHGARQPDPAAGLTFPVQAHGTIYVEPWEGRLFYGLLIAQIVPLTLLVLTTRNLKSTP